MAHERLSPRQKMIGMMYLVLTALLALNVSKEAVEAFKKVDQGLTKTISNYEAKNSIIYDDFDRVAAQNPIKAGPAKENAYEVKQRSDELFNYIQDLKIEMIKRTQGDDTPAINGREIDIMKVEKRIDDNNVPSEIMIGANEQGKANDLKALLASYRDDMIDLLNGKNISIEESLKNMFNTDDQINDSGEKERWENYTFQLLPLVAAITVLSKLQVDVRNAETDVLNFLYSQIDARSYKFNLIVPTITTNSTYVMRGNEYQASVFITAVDTTQVPDIMVGNYTTTTNADGTKSYEMTGDYVKLPVDESGKGVYKVRTNSLSLGQKPWGGLVAMKAPDGTVVNYPFRSEFTVGEPNVVVSPTAMNVLYAGIDNPIDISVPGIGSDKVRVSMNNGTITRGKVKNQSGQNFPGEYKALPSPSAIGQIAEINVSAEINGKLQGFPPRPFRIKPIPKPVATFANKQGEAKLSKEEILIQSAVFANIEGFDFDLRYNVTEFKVTINERGFDQSETSTNNRITDAQKALLGRLTRGKKLYIEGIKAVGPDNRPQDLSPIIITVN
jgi:gliding motility-associated protein GldM